MSKKTDAERLAKLEESLSARLGISLADHDEPAVEAAAVIAKEKKPLTIEERCARLEIVVKGALGVSL